MLEKKEGVLLKKVAAEVEKAKEYTRAKNKRGISYIFLSGNLKDTISAYSLLFQVDTLVSWTYFACYVTSSRFFFD